MLLLRQIIEPEKLLLVWEPIAYGKNGHRHVVGELLHQSGEQVVLHYLKNAEDFKKAQQHGFEGYATALFILGMTQRLYDLADVRDDLVGLQLEEERLPKRVGRIRKPKKST